MNTTAAREFVEAQLINAYTPNELRVIVNALFEDLLGLSSGWLIRADALTPDQMQRIHQAVDRMIQGEPLQYVTGIAHFYKMILHVSPAVLIPRPETEELVSWADDELAERIANRGEALTIMDIGTGSGCIPIALSALHPSLNYYGMDISEDALAVAATNAKRYSSTVQWIHDDMTSPQKNYPEFDLIISNPPYIPFREAAMLDRQVIEYEPHLALFEPDDEPLKYYEAVIRFAKRTLRAEGIVMVEMHQDYAQRVLSLFQSYFSHTELRKDISGHERMLKAVGIV
ncbi:MAG: peptide chain release factor N(5)-glutamine methyltransferase [Bacteroidota bacterium]